ncbi:hypothetical protein HMPREF0004_5601 [Achromobacter piechaudii ATCC 43553]|uniref:Uncharacterized protein n=1 Tax=Achromobacter piechaudii ATCC 43553 TaxID=742159 RepID=D4XJF4_9BURK|nr:hypothetical protein HMPREF0004_5601 [Achromobacter piechaudii ATCC 43553]
MHGRLQLATRAACQWQAPPARIGRYPFNPPESPSRDRRVASFSGSAPGKASPLP